MEREIPHLEPGTWVRLLDVFDDWCERNAELMPTLDAYYDYFDPFVNGSDLTLYAAMERAQI